MLEHLFLGEIKPNIQTLEATGVFCVRGFGLHLKHARLLDWLPTFGNCRYYSLYLDEDLVGRMKYPSCTVFFVAQWVCEFSLANEMFQIRRVLNHSHVRTLSVNGLNRYAMGVALRWAGRDALLNP